MMNNLTPAALVLARVLIALIFVSAGYSKIGGYDGTLQYMDAFGVPGMLLPLVILAELGGGLAIIAGFLTRFSAISLAIFSVVSALIFHANFAEPMQQILFMKNVSMAGGLLVLAVQGPGAWSLDGKLGLKY